MANTGKRVKKKKAKTVCERGADRGKMLEELARLDAMQDVRDVHAQFAAQCYDA